MVTKITSPVTPLGQIEKINEIIDALGTGGVTIDDITITRNSNDELQAIGVIDDNSGNALKTWTGTRAQYDTIATKDPNTLYNITDDANMALSLLETLYPVGAIYIGTMSVCPLQVLGVGTWELKAVDRVLQGAGETYTAGATIEAGLPNIQGQVGALYGGNLETGVGLKTGCFTNTTFEGTQSIKGTNASLTLNNINFAASTSNSIYGNSSTVQPPAYVVNIWERIS